MDGGNPTSGCVVHSYVSDTSAMASCTVGNGPSGSGSSTQPIHVETSTPVVQAVAPSPDSNGWYDGPVSVAFAGSSFSGIASCTTATYAGPDTLGASVSGSCTDNAGKTVSASSPPLRVEISTPVVHAVLGRPPDSNGWYNYPLNVVYAGSSFSGIAACATTTYAGPDSPSAKASGSCTDNAGKTVKATSSPFAYDGNPSLHLAARPGDHTVVLRWASADVAPLVGVEIVRSPGLLGKASSIVYRGHGTDYRDVHVRNGVRYRYTLRARDRAGNTIVRTAKATPGPRLLAPAAGARLDAPPLLRWTPVPGASYYNVQLHRGGEKVLSAWPSRSSLQLTRRWSYKGPQSLRAGRYYWYVWPGFGPRAASRYGPEIGRRKFLIVGLG
jgi:hypothetical protein